MLEKAATLSPVTTLQDTVGSGLKQVLVTAVPVTSQPVITDYMYCYRRSG